MRWGEDGWLRTLDGDALPVATVGSAASESAPARERDDFAGAVLPPAFQWLRTPYPEQIFSLSARPGWLRLHGRETIGSHFTQALVARRPLAFRYAAETLLDYAPANFQQAAGLVCYYNATKFHFLHITVGDAGERLAQVLSVLPLEEGVSAVSRSVAVGEGTVALRAEVDHERLRFGVRGEGEQEWTWLPETFAADLLSDEATLPGLPNFTGTFIGMACQDMSGVGLPADFRYFHYLEEC